MLLFRILVIRLLGGGVMGSWWKKQSKARKIVLIGAVIFALLMGIGDYSGNVEQTKRAARMAISGQEATAIPMQINEESKRDGPFTSHKYSVNYKFADANGRVWDGSAELNEEEFGKMFDPAQPKIIRKDARLPIMYDRAKPSDNGLKRLFIKPASEPSLLLSMLASFVGVGIALLILTKMWRFAYGTKDPTR